MFRILLISENAKDLFPLFKLGECSVHASDGRARLNGQAKAGLLPHRCDIAFLDLDLPAWQQKLLDLRMLVPVIAFSKQDIGKAVEAMKLGASDYLCSPFDGAAVSKVTERYARRTSNQSQGFEDLIGMTPSMREVFSLIKKAAVSESNVLITGESGTGKEPVARAIHRWSPRAGLSFMTINCSAIPDTLLESELFGFEKGAFTGANYTKKGILELATGGTVFFDEVGDVSPLFQTKILRVLQEGEIMRIGGMSQIKVDVRTIAATNKDLKAACRKGNFREDLFFRLNVINIHLPPLRERMEDVPLLVEHFIQKHASKRKDLLVRAVADETLQILMGYNYPGNVRELENIIEHAISFTTFPELLPSDLPTSFQYSAPKRRQTVPRMKESLMAYESELIWSALRESRGNITKAAASLGIYRQELQRKLKRLKIAP